MKSVKKGECEGLLLVNKKEGMTSHDVVDFIRKRFNLRKAGHGGTLDPMATGLLIIMIGRYTKIAQRFLGYDKEYIATMLMGISTDTGDKEGKIISERGASQDKLSELEKICDSFKGEIEQVPPMFSAKKVKGKKLYELARRGVTIHREPKKVVIKSIEIKNVSDTSVTIYVKCSKGTYIRQLAHDIGERIGCGAHLTKLERTKIGPFSLENAVTLEELKKMKVISHENLLRPE